MGMFVKDQVGRQIYEDAEFIADTDIDWEKWKNKTVLITGANGFIAYYLVLAFLIRNDVYHDNIKVLGLVRNQEKAAEKYGDILNRDDILLIGQDVCQDMGQIQPADFVIHAASQASPYYFENDPVGTIDANTSGTVNVLEYAVKSKSESVLIISSIKVYGEVRNGQGKIKEEDIGYLDITSYKNCYAQGKRTSETLCASYCRQYGINVKIARPSYIYGASSLEDDRVWAQFLANIIKKEDILLKSNGAAYRSFCYVADTARALLMVLMKGENAVPYNIAADHSDTTIRNFAKTAVQVFPERNMKLCFQNREDEQEPVLDFGGITPEILDSSKLQSLGWKGEIDLAEGIRRAVNTMESR